MCRQYWSVSCLFTIIITVSTCSWSEPHEGDANIFPGNSMSLPARVEPHLQHVDYGPGFLGEVVPMEDSDQLPVVNDPMALGFVIGNERYRYTHSRHNTMSLREALTTPGSGGIVFSYYIGENFRDGVHRISAFLLQ